MDIYRLLTQASQKYSASTAPVSSATASNFADPVDLTLLYTTNVSYTIPSVNVVVQEDGIYYLQHLVRGIASNSVRFEVEIDKGWSLIPADTSHSMFNGAATYTFPTSSVVLLLISLSFLWGSTKYVHPVVCLISIAMATFYIWVVINGNSKSNLTIDSILQIVCLSATIFLYLCALLQLGADICQGKPPEQGRDFWARQQRVYYDYTYGLLQPPSCAEVQVPQIEGSDAETKKSVTDVEMDVLGAPDEAMTIEKYQAMKEAEEKAAELYASRTSVVAHWKASLNSVFTGTNKDAFFYPQRVMITFVLSIVTNVGFYIILINNAIRIRQSINDYLAGRAIDTIFKYVIQLENYVRNLVGTQVTDMAEEWAYRQACMHDVPCHLLPSRHCGLVVHRRTSSGRSV